MHIELRRGHERGHANRGWLDSFHTFSFGEYRDPQHMGFRALRVINEDRVVPGRGFSTHGHRDMEIVSYVLEGALEHRDSMGTGSIIRPGDVQRMSAGTGVMHSEFNASQSEEVHFLQIWIVPERQGLEPSYEQKSFSREERAGKLRLIASSNGREGSITVHQDVDLYAAILSPDSRTDFELRSGRNAWIQVARGEVQIGEHVLRAGDGAAIADGGAIELSASEESEVLLFDLA